MAINPISKIFQFLQDFAWFTGIGISIAILLLTMVGLIPALSGDNFQKHFFSYLIVIFIAFCSLNNIVTTPFFKYKLFTLIGEFTVIVGIAALIALFESPQISQRMKHFVNAGDALATAREGLNAYSQLLTSAGWEIVLNSYTFYVLVFPFTSYYLLRYMALQNKS